MERETRSLIMIGTLVLVLGFLIGLSSFYIFEDSEVINYGTIYLKQSEIEYAIGLKEKTGANVIVIGLLGETFEDIVPEGNIKDFI